MHIYFQYAAMFFLGQAFHLFAVKIPSLKEKSIANNHSFNFGNWLKEDWNIIIATTSLGAMAMIGLDEILKLRQEIENVVRLLFGSLGFLSNSITMRASKYEKKIMRYLDLKANIADATVGKTRNIDDLIQKGNEQTGTDVTQSPLQYGNNQKAG